MIVIMNTSLVIVVVTDFLGSDDPLHQYIVQSIKSSGP